MLFTFEVKLHKLIPFYVCVCESALCNYTLFDDSQSITALSIFYNLCKLISFYLRVGIKFVHFLTI